MPPVTIFLFVPIRQGIMSHPSFAEVVTQLHHFGYKAGSKVYLRAFAAKNTPLDVSLRHGMAWQTRDGHIIPIIKEGYLNLFDDHCTFIAWQENKQTGRWGATRSYSDGLAYLTQLNQQGYGIYLIVNEGGRLDPDINRCPALFYECDNISKEEQFEKIEELTREGYQPSFVLETRNSLHTYFRTYEEDAEDWRIFQQRLIQRQDSDKTIHNPNRLMRLAGFYHWQWNKETQQLESFRLQIRLVTQAIYRRFDFDGFLPAHDTQRWQDENSGRGFKELAPTDPSENPWDVRNFAHYLDGYRQDARRRFGHTAKCPAHDGTSDNSLHINRDTGAVKCHGSGSCPGKEIYHAALALAISRGYQVPARRSGYSYKAKSVVDNAVAGLVAWVKRQAAKIPWGLGAKAQNCSITLQSNAAIDFYESGTRLEMWRQKMMQGYRHILDTSGTGTGKSHDAGLTSPETLGAKKLFYVSEEHRNPSTATVAENYVDCPPRHNGFFRDEHGRQRREGKEGEGYVVAPNCGRTMTGAALRDKQIDGADETSLLCQTCGFLESCRKGKDFGYIRQRSEALGADRTRIHPLSLPSCKDADGNISHDYSEEILIHDEAGQIFNVHRNFQVSVFDLQRTIADLAIAAPEQFQSIQGMLGRLLKHMRGEVAQTNKYGWNHRDTVGILMQDGLLVDISSVRQALTVELREMLNTTDKYGVDIADLPSGMRRNFSDGDRTAAERIRAEVPLQWLPEVLEILTGVTPGSLQINVGKLTVTVADYRYREVVQQAKANIYLDATTTREEMAWLIGCDPDEIAVVQQCQAPVENLGVTQVTGLGRLGISGRSDFLQKRVDAVVNHLIETLPGQTAVIDFKRYNTAGDGRWAWYRDSRGINDLQDILNLLLVGTPCPNLAATEAEYICTTGRIPQPGTVQKTFSIQIPGKENDSQEAQFTCEVSADPDFADYCHQKIVANIIQAIGRLRADRRPGQKLNVYFLGDYPLPMPVKLLRAMDITLEAADKVEQLTMAIQKRKETLEASGEKVSQRIVAALEGIAKSTVARYWNCPSLLLKTINSGMGQFAENLTEGSDAHILGTEYLPALAQEDPVDQVQGLLNAFQAHGCRVMSQAWSFLSAAASVQLQTGLLLALPEAEFKQLAAIT